ncbi:hypothetical protein AHAS_Ahas05G0209800 [Arachis hypogaea]
MEVTSRKLKIQEAGDLGGDKKETKENANPLLQVKPPGDSNHNIINHIGAITLRIFFPTHFIKKPNLSRESPSSMKTKS